jgi:SNF2 family DNA or RNA helicase
MAAELDNLARSGRFDAAAWYAGDDTGEKFGMLGAIHTAMEMMLDHPDLLVISAKKFRDGKGGSRYCYAKWQHDLVDDVTDSPKLALLAEKTDAILEFAPENKVVVFTKYAEMVPYIADYLGYPAQVYHGKMSTAQKQAAIENFAGEYRLLISTHAGAYGTDMYMASHLIGYDLPYSYGRHSQITGRHARAASEFSKIYTRDIVMTGTIEERNLARIRFKKKVADAVVDDLQSSEAGDLANEVETLRSHLDRVLGRG